MIAYTITDDSVNLVVNGDFRNVSRDRIDADKVIQAVEAAQSGEITVEELMAYVEPKERIQLESDGRFVEDPETGDLYLRGTDEPIGDLLAERILTFLSEDHPVDPLVEFHKNCLLNPDFPEIEDQLYRFLSHNGHPITKEGFFIGYKKVGLADYYERQEDGSVEQAGYAKRDDLREDADQPYARETERFDPLTGEVYTEEIDLSSKLKFVDLYTEEMDNSIGQVVSMDREDVVKDPTRSCAPGLHVASMCYLPNYGLGTSISSPAGERWADMSDAEIHEYISGLDTDPVVEVLVNPRHVVSVPHAHNAEKMRTEQYYVHGLMQGEYDQDYAPIEHYVEEETEAMKAELESDIEAARQEAEEQIDRAEGIKGLFED